MFTTADLPQTMQAQPGATHECGTRGCPLAVSTEPPVPTHR